MLLKKENIFTVKNKCIITYSVLSFKCSLTYCSITFFYVKSNYKLQTDLSTKTYSDIINELMAIFRSVIQRSYSLLSVLCNYKGV